MASTCMVALPNAVDEGGTQERQEKVAERANEEDRVGEWYFQREADRMQ